MPAPQGVPTGTYRFQLTPDEGFATVAAAADHLGRLGVSHAYLSPVLAAAPGSTHGYDVVDHGLVNPELGGAAGLTDAVRQLADRGLGVVVDVVPNHMTIPVPERLNAVLWSVLRDGPGSRYARWFDVDWREERSLLLPVLGRRLADCLDASEIALDHEGDEPVLRYHDHVFPVRPGTEHLDLEPLLDAQHYRLAYWQVSDEELNYRRFFDVDTLVAVRVEDPEVFEATHATVLELVHRGAVQGLRIDHPDGLADPAGYLRRLVAAAPGTWVVVEKILEGDEQLPADWPCAGTTGYEALLRVQGLFVDPAGGPVLRESFAELAGVAQPFPAVAAASKRFVAEGALASEVARLAALAHRVCQSELRLRDHSRRGLREAVVELLVALPVYRAYVVPGEQPPAESVRLLRVAGELATERRPGRADEIALLVDLALGHRGRSADKDELVVRFQQTTGPVMAKGVEDTAFYRWFPLSALCEVGGEPDRFGVAPEEFHAWAGRALAERPAGMTTLSTHDTKRSEDVRARLAGLAEVPLEWSTALRALRSAAGEAPCDDGLTEWLAWQTIVGAWPIDADRLERYLTKAMREAKLRTGWGSPDEGYERAVLGWARAALADDAVLAVVRQLVDRLHPAFVANVLGQKLVQLLVPGVPDVYQGTEVVSLALVDPDNRSPLDVARVSGALDRALADVPDPAGDLDAAKARVVASALRLRAEHPGWFGAGSTYRGLEPSGDGAEHVVAFARGDGEPRVVVAATRFPLRLASRGGFAAAGATLPVPDGAWQDLLGGGRHEVPDPAAGGGLAVEALLADWPVALLVRDEG